MTIGDVLHAESAWRRDSRVFEVALAIDKQVGAPFAVLERLLVRGLVKTGVVSPVALEDSVAIFARRRTASAPVQR